MDLVTYNAVAPAEQRDVPTLLAEAAAHAADALPELLVLARGGDQFDIRFRPYINEIVHCLASGLEAVLQASRQADAAGRRGGEDALAVMVRDFLDRAAA